MVRTLEPLLNPFLLGSSAPGPHHEEDATLDVEVQATVLQVVVEPEDAAWMGLAVEVGPVVWVGV